TDYYYRVSYTQGGTTNFSQTFHVRTPAAIFALRGAFPNPTGGLTRIDYELAMPGHTTLSLYDLSGRRVRTLLSGQFGPGAGSILWDGRSDAGLRVAAGQYFARLVSGGQARTLRIMLLN